MATNPLPDLSVLLKLLVCNPETGELFWKERDISMFSADAKHSAEMRMQIWNTKNAGKPAICSKNPQGYCRGSILRQPVAAHRVIWKMVTGEEPLEIDHINGNRSDNRFCNLRSVTRAANTRNRQIPTHNTSGVIGVSRRANGKWYAQMRYRGEQFYLGTYDAMEDAVRARKAAERRLGFHPNHGRKCRA